MLRFSVSRTVHRQLLLTRWYSDKPTYNKHNFSQFDKLDKYESAKPNHQHYKPADSQSFEQSFGMDQPQNISDRIQEDHRLQQLKSGTAEYKRMQQIIHEELVKEHHHQSKSWEFWERVKGVVAGVLALVSIIAAHQILTRWSELKSKYYHNWKYKVDTSAADLKDDELNKKSTNKVIAKLEQELPAVEATIQPSSKPGLYLSGETGTKLPSRIPFFEGKNIKDVATNGEYAAVVDSKGKLYVRSKRDGEWEVVSMPSLKQVAVSETLVVGLTTGGKVVYMPREQTGDFKGDSCRSWTGNVGEKTYATIEVPKITQMGVGAGHVIMLSSSNQVLVAKTSDVNDRGQYGIPQVPEDRDGHEVTLLNKQLVVNESGDKQVKYRKLVGVAAGEFHNLAVDDNNNIYAWGDNSYGQCALDVGFTTNRQPLPKMIIGQKDLPRLLRNYVSKDARSEDFLVSKVYASKGSSYVQVSFQDQVFILSFGYGVSGQLGTRYMQMCSHPRVIKQLTGTSEYDEKKKKSVPIGIDSFSTGGDHCVVTMANQGPKDVLAFGENYYGQLANGKTIKTSTPVALPKLVEPEEVGDSKKLTERLADTNNYRLQMADGQRIKACEGSTAIFYP